MSGRQQPAGGDSRHRSERGLFSVCLLGDCRCALLSYVAPRADCRPAVSLRSTVGHPIPVLLNVCEQLVTSTNCLFDTRCLQRDPQPPCAIVEFHSEGYVVGAVVVVDVVKSVVEVFPMVRKSSEGHVAFSRMGTHQKPTRTRIAASFFHEDFLVHIPASRLAGSTVALQGSVATRHRGGPTRLGGRAVPDAPGILGGKRPMVKRYGAESTAIRS